MLRVATYNLYLGADLGLLVGAGPEFLADRVAFLRGQLERTRFPERAAAIAAVLRRVDADVVGLQEVVRWTATPWRDGSPAGGDRVLVDFLPVLLAELEAAGCVYRAHAVSASFTGALPVGPELVTLTGANVMLVRRAGPVVAGERTGILTAVHELDVGLTGAALPITRSWGALDLVVDRTPVTVLNTHTEAYHPATRDAQRDELLGLLAEVAGPVVLLGDLNATPDEVGVPAPYADAWTAAGNDPAAGHTCGQAAELANCPGSLDARIDYVWVRDLVVRRCSVAGDRPEDRSRPHGLWPSDHACVVADLALR